MPLPQFADKHLLDALVRPADALGHLGWTGAPAPAGAVMVYSRRLVEEVQARYPRLPDRKLPGVPGYREIAVPAGTVALVGGFGIGAPAAAVVLEELVAAGTRWVVSVGGAGGLCPEQAIGDVVVCDRALRDEGVSHHYLPPDEPLVRPDPTLSGLLATAVRARFPDGVEVGGTWTTDAPYRETREEVRRYRGEGLLTVEMEAAALAAVARHRGVGFATAFAVMDSLAGPSWRPEGLRHRDAFQSLNLLVDAALDALAAATRQQGPDSHDPTRGGRSR